VNRTRKKGQGGAPSRREEGRRGGKSLGSSWALESDGEVCRSEELRRAILLRPVDGFEGKQREKREESVGYLKEAVAWRGS
jgi:hypothetical protein